MEYLNKVSEAAAEDSRLQQELGAAYLKVGDLQGEPGHPNLRDIASARNSYARSAAILEEQLKADPHNPELQHLLTVASLRKAQLEPTEEKIRSAVERVRRAAEKITAREPSNLQAQSDLADALLVEPPASNGYLDCSVGCSGSVVDREAYSIGETQNERRAVAIRRRILEQGPRTAQARWELASVQIELASAVWSEYSKDGREVLRQALASLDELVLLDPANVQYKRDRGRALSLSARFEQDARRPSEAERLGQQALALMQQVVDSDPRNAGFRLDLNNVQFMVGYLLVKNGDQAGGMKYLNQAVALQEEQAKSQPGNPDFLLQTAVFHTRIGAVGASFTDYRAALVHQREAESIYRKLVREHPDDKAYLQRLAAQLPLVAQSIAGSGDKSAAIPVYRESISLWEKLNKESDGAAETGFGLGKAYAYFAQGLQAIARLDDAIAQDLAAIAIFERSLASAPRPDKLRAAQASANRHLATVYLSRNDIRSALRAELRAVAFLEANQAARPNNYYAYANLNDAYGYIQNDYARLHEGERALATGLKEMDLAEKYSARNPEQISALQDLAFVHGVLSITYGLLLGRRTESLAAIREAGAVLDNISSERNVVAESRRTTAWMLVLVVDRLRRLEKQTEAARLGQKAIALTEGLVRSDPRNAAFRSVLRSSYLSSSAIAGDLNDFETYIQMRTQVQKLDLEHPQETAQFWQDLGTNQFGISSAQDLSGDSGAAAQSRRQAVEYVLKARSLAESAVSSLQGKNLSAFQDLIDAAIFLSFVSERSGDLRAALEYRQEHIAAARKELEADPPTPLLRRGFSNSNARRAFGTFNRSEGSGFCCLDSAVGWPLHASRRTSVSRLSVCRGSREGVEIARAVVAANPPHRKLAILSRRLWTNWDLPVVPPP